MERLTEKDFHSIISLLSTEHLFLNVMPIVNKSFKGNIWADDVTNPKVGYANDSRKAHFLFGDVKAPKTELLNFVKSKILPKIKVDKWGILVYEESWQNILKMLKENVSDNIKILERQLYKFTATSIDPFKFPIPEKIKIFKITKEVLNRNLNNIKGLKDELIYMWGDIDRFFKYGFGICAISDDSLAGWCLGEYFNQINMKVFGIGIETYPKFQKQGIASAMTCRLVELGLIENFSIYWDCSKTNLPSIKTALKVGFILQESYKVILIKF